MLNKRWEKIQKKRYLKENMLQVLYGNRDGQLYAVLLLRMSNKIKTLQMAHKRAAYQELNLTHTTATYQWPWFFRSNSKFIIMNLIPNDVHILCRTRYYSLFFHFLSMFFNAFVVDIYSAYLRARSASFAMPSNL